jgi:hypothetical protein
MWLKRPRAYIFLAEQALVLASHMPPALWQSALVFAVVTSPNARIQGIRDFYALVAAEPRVSMTAIQTVGVKGYDGFAVALVVAQADGQNNASQIPK